jgi:S-DNA-T family DNA segregation ATPase FtsK/SpoIIIE
MARRGRKKSPFKIKLRVETVYSLGALLMFAVACLLMISFSGQGESLQEINTVLRESFGAVAVIVPFLFISGGMVLTQAKWSFAKPQVLLGAFLFFLSALTLGRSGGVGSALYQNFSDTIQPAGTNITFFLVGVAGFLVLTDTSLKDLFGFVASMFEVDASEKSDKKKEDKEDAGFKITGLNLGKKGEEKPVEEGTATPETGGFTVNTSAAKAQAPVDESPVVTSSEPLSNEPGAQVWEYPPLSILSNKPGKEADGGDLRKNADTIEETLSSFGIRAQVREANLGPAVTQYAIELSHGTKVTKVTSLANDLALRLAAPQGQIRIEAPIPGRNYVGIEVPNQSLQVVTLRQLLASKQIKENKSKLAVPLGLNVAGEAVVADIGKMPHALIAGSTGSGKSVAINSFITSLLFRASPEEVKFIMVDPKRVELTQYNGIPHLLTPVITEPKKVVAALKWATAEMDKRYKVFAEVGVRNIAGYNEMAGFQAMPYIVIIIDELADLMLFAPAEAEEAITRIAQMARAVGIHLLLATQRPSVDVITGLIKANIPTRIAFNVSSVTDSRVVLDTPGAEKLLGRGDMLYIPPDQAKPQRIQGTMVTDKEIHELISFIKNQSKPPEYQEEVISKFESSSVGGSGGTGSDEQDEFFRESVQIVMESGKGSASYIQRRLSVGYNRAARILDQLAEAGIVGPAQGSKPREVNMTAAKQFLAGGEQEQA